VPLLDLKRNKLGRGERLKFECMQEKTIEPRGRDRALSARRRLKMAESAHAYVRGNTVKFYEWLMSVEASHLIPEGPPVWICGDCHIGNLGPVASADGEIEIQIRDLDQTVIGNPAHDMIRLSLSLAMAARSSDLPGVTTALMVEEVIRGYRQALLGKSASVKQGDITPVRLVMRQAKERRWRHLAEERIEDVKPEIPLGRRFWKLSSRERREIDRIFVHEDVRSLVTGLKGRSSKASISVLDAAYWMKGCSSLGRLRYAILVGIGKGNRDGFSLIDVKEAARAAAPRSKNAAMPRDNARRVVHGAQALSPFLGERMLATKFHNRSVVLRELMPQDLKFEMEGLSRADAISAANLFAAVVGKAHARQMDSKTRREWAHNLSNNHTKTLNAPSWLWTSVVDLAATHEAAYLNHCRQFANGML
jgi:uncharacterized protein (DUF2252 family)